MKNVTWLTFTYYCFPGAGAGAGLGGYKAKIEAGVDVFREKLTISDKAEFNTNLGVNVNTGSKMLCNFINR